jgi:hypothetical protein
LRHETRSYEVFLPRKALAGSEWNEHVACINRVQRDTLKRSLKDTHETAYYVCDIVPSAKEVVRAIREHWGIENRSHCVREAGLFNALYMNLIDCSSAMPPIARLYLVLATFSARLKRRMLAANERILAKTPGFLRIREASSAKLPSRTLKEWSLFVRSAFDEIPPLKLNLQQ